MTTSKNDFINLVILAISCCFCENPAASSAVVLHPTLSPWVSLNYQSSKYFVTMRAEIALSRVSGDIANSSLSYSPAECKPLSLSEDYISLSISTQVMGQHTQSVVLMNSDSRVIDNNARREGPNKRQRSYRYCDDSVYLRKRRPKSTEEELSWREWTDIRDESYLLAKPFPEPLTEVESIFYLVAAAKSYSQDQSFHIYVYDKHGIVDYQVKVNGEKRIRVNFEERDVSGEKHVDGFVDAVVLTVEPVFWGVEKAASDELPGLLGLKGSLQLFVDPVRRVVLELSGTAEYLGKVRIRLTEIGRSIVLKPN